ncbi:MAG: protease modulator HflC [Gemmataceae bacterium]|nr:protease modulator HflC [Gemmataceae bacterium]
MKKYILTPLAIVTIITLARWSMYTVDAAEYAYVTVLGEHRVTYDGSDSANGAGLKFGWPWPIQQVQRLDRRLQQFDLPAQDQLTYDPAGKAIDKLLSLEAYVCWRIIDRDGVDLFVRRIGTADRARTILEPLVSSRLGAAVGEMPMDDFISTTIADPVDGRTRVDVALDKLRQRLLVALRGPARDEYGIDLVDIRLRRFNHPGDVRGSIFSRIKAERNAEATKYIADGERQAANKKNEADADIREQLAKAKSEEERIKAEADVEAMKIRNHAYSQDREFYEFLKKMEKLQNILGDSKTMLLLSTHRPAFESLFTPPRPKQRLP